MARVLHIHRLIQLCQLLLPYLQAHGHGRIIGPLGSRAAPIDALSGHLIFLLSIPLTLDQGLFFNLSIYIYLLTVNRGTMWTLTRWMVGRDALGMLG